MTSSIHVGILGASGYGAGELLRLLTQHPHAQVVSVTSGSQAGTSVDRIHPHLHGFWNLQLRESLDVDWLLAAEYAVIFSALPHAASAAALAVLLKDGLAAVPAGRLKIIDLSGDLRLADVAVHAAHYADTPVMPELRRDAVYGLPELGRAVIRGARLIANPGCLATAAILAIAPLVGPSYSGSIVIDAKTGSSGSGRLLKETTHHPTRHADFRAYKPLAHQHEPEILQALRDPRGERLTCSFVAQSMDAARGIFITSHLTLPEESNASTLRERFEQYYADSPFIRIVRDSPALQNVVGSNFCDIGVACRGKQVIVMAALDNLVKGMAGTAIQNMNLMCGLPEITGLWAPALRPV